MPILCSFKEVRISVYIYMRARVHACSLPDKNWLSYHLEYKKYFLGECKMHIVIVELLLQNHRGVEVGRVLCRLVIWYNSSAQRWSLRAGCQDLVWMASEYLQRWRLHNLSWQPMPVLSQPPQWKSVSSCSEFPSFFFCLWSCQWARLKKAWLGPLCIQPSGISPGWIVPALPHSRDVPVCLGEPF